MCGLPSLLLFFSKSHKIIKEISNKLTLFAVFPLLFFFAAFHTTRRSLLLSLLSFFPETTIGTIVLLRRHRSTRPMPLGSRPDGLVLLSTKLLRYTYKILNPFIFGRKHDIPLHDQDH